MAPHEFKTRLLLAATAAFCLWAAFAPAKKKDDPLPPKYKKWLDEEVVYIISKAERDIFRKLPSDSDRDRFVQAFWDARDPTPGTPRNEFKEEHYSRIQYANTKYGMEGGPGWRTDRGRIYIQLGAPSQVFDWHYQYQLYPMELWFYSLREHPSVLHAFYLIFWQREGAGSFKLYSPYNDGPERLVHSNSFSSRRDCFEYLRSINAELARSTLSYIPGEPVDMEALTGSVSSDILVNSIFRIPEEEAPTRYLNMFRPGVVPKEKIDTKYSYQFGPVQSAFLPVVDDRGGAMLHYAFQISPQDLSIARFKDQYYVSLEITTSVLDEKDQTLFRRRQELVRYFSEAEFEKVKSLGVIFQDKLGIVSGRQKVEVVAFNKINGQSYRCNKSVDVPEIPAVAPAVGPLVPVGAFAQADGPGGSANSAFTFFNYRFEPLMERRLSLAEKLSVLTQLYFPPESVKDRPEELLKLEFSLIPDGGTEPAKTVADEIPRGKFNKMGCLLNFKQIQLTGVPLGRYSLVVVLMDASGRKLAGGNLPVTLDGTPRQACRVYFAEDMQADDSGIYDYQRSRILDKLGRAEEASELLRLAAVKNPGLTLPALDLATAELGSGQALAAVDRLNAVKLNRDFPAAGALLLAEACAAAGRVGDAREAASKFLGSGPASREQYTRLAAVYDRAGDAATAEEMRKKSGAAPQQK